MGQDILLAGERGKKKQTPQLPPLSIILQDAEESDDIPRQVVQYLAIRRLLAEKHTGGTAERLDVNPERRQVFNHPGRQLVFPAVITHDSPVTWRLHLWRPPPVP